jgi:hypothetical protein
MRWLANATDRDHMEGFVNAFFFPFVDEKGLGVIDPGTWIPKPDPLMAVGDFITDPAKCGPPCIGVFKFKIRRVSAP